MIARLDEPLRENGGAGEGVAGTPVVLWLPARDNFAGRDREMFDLPLKKENTDSNPG